MGGWSLIRLRWEARRAYRRHGWPLPVFLLAVAVAATAGWRAFWNDHRVADELTARANEVMRPEQPPVEPLSSAGRDAFYAVLPSESQRFTVLKTILAAAEKHNVLPAEVDYKVQREPHTRLVRYAVSLPVDGRWTDVQAFLKSVLSGHRSAVVDVLKLHRDDADHPSIYGQVEISILMRREPEMTSAKDTATAGAEQ